MPRLLLTLLLGVLVLSIGLGKLFDQLYAGLAPVPQYSKPDAPEQWLPALGQSLQQLAAQQQLSTQQFVASWPLTGQTALTVQPLASFPLPEPVLQQLQQGQTVSLQSEDQQLWLLLLADSAELLQFSVILPPEQTDWWAFGFTLLFYLALFWLLLLWLWPLLKRLKKLRDSARLFSEGQLSARLQVGPVFYLRDLENEFNRMASRIEQLMTDVRLLSGAMSHELRNPLTRLRLGIDMLEDTEDPQLRQHYLQRVNRDLDSMSELIEALLQFSRLELRLSTASNSKVDFCALLRQRLSLLQDNQSHSDRPTECRFELPSGPLWLWGEPTYLQLLLDNLLDNACKYGAGVIRLTLAQSAGNGQKHRQWLELQVSDNGPGICASEQSQIFQPFVRGSNSEQRSGFGLGLALVQRITLWHQGHIQQDSCPLLGGARFRLKFPLVGN